MADDQLFYVAQKALIEKDGEILVLHDPQMGIDVPGGKIQISESDLIKSLQREIEEETGIKAVIGEPFYTDYFEFPKDMDHRHAGKRIFVVFYKARYISGTVKLSDEHDTYKWVNNENYKELVVTEKRYDNTYSAIEKFFENN